MDPGPYRLAALVYDFVVEPFMSPVRRETARLLLAALEGKASPRILELACGTGGQIREIQRRALSVIGLDLSPAMLRRALMKNRLPGERGRFHAVRADAASLPIAGKRFDAVVAQLALHEMDPPVRHRCLAEMLRITGPRAVFMLVDFAALPRPNFSTCLITAIERAAGTRHYRNGRHFLANGGLEGLIRAAPQLRVEDRQPFFQRNLDLIVARKV